MSQGPASVFAMNDLRAPLIGREAYLERLNTATEAAGRGEPRAVTLIGPAGVGKSRLVHELLLELRVAGGKPPRVYRGSARSMQLSYGVFARLLRSRFGLVEGMDPEAAKAQVRAQVAQVVGDRKVEDVCYFLGQLLDLAFLESPLTKAVGEDATEARLLRRAILKSFLEADAAHGTLCLVLEDVHLCDDDSLELLRYLVEHLQGSTLLVCLARPELLERLDGWAAAGGTRHELIELEPLDEAGAKRVIEALLSPCEGGPPPALVEAAVGMANGNPGMLEQMVRIFHDVGVLDERDALARDPVWKLHLDKLADARLPMSVEDAVEARITALLPTERRVMEHAAAMGSVFWLGGLVALERAERNAPEYWQNDGDVETLRAVVQSLVERDYVLELPDSSFSGDVEYVFKHNLERERVSKLTSATAARRYHQVIADYLASKDGVQSQEESSAMLADHLNRAGSAERAGQVYLDAGDLARANYAAKKAAEYYKLGLELNADGDARRRIDALHNYGDVLILLGRTDEALTAFRELLDLAYRIGARAKGGAGHNRIGRLHRDTGSLSLALKHLETAKVLFEAAEDERGISASHDDIGKVLWLKGDYDAALKEMKTALDMRKKIGDRRSIALSLNNIGLVWLDHGRTKQASEALEAALTIRREIHDPLGVVQSLNNLGRLAQEVGDHNGALARFREAYEEAREIGEHNRIAVVLTNIGETHYRLGDPDQAVKVLQQAEALCDEMGDRLHLAEAKRALAKAHLLQKDLRKAREAIREAVDLFGQVRSKSHLAGALRTLGEITGAGAWGAGHEVKAVDYFMRSIALFKEIGNELETGRSYRAFSEYVQGSGHYKDNSDIQREAVKLSQMADEIFERHRRFLASTE